ncbi:MAG: plastocyanin [Spirulinaceae cyanobacterium]
MLVVASFILSAQPAQAQTYTVKMGTDSGELEFVPEILTIEPGDTIKFVMNKLAPHNVVFWRVPSGDSALSRQLSNPKLMFSAGQSYSTQFPEDAPAGEYDYYCQPHRGAGMIAKIIVEG